jgi:hypothetical protein
MEENGTVVTIERENNFQEEVTPPPKKPSVQTFKEIVERHCHNWGVTLVQDLCSDQTRALIDELAEHFR